MFLQLKPCVSLIGLRPETLLGILAAYSIFQHYGYAFVVTSVTDGKHSKTSLHYPGFAFDIRTKHLEGNQVLMVMLDLKSALPHDFDIINESTHIHIEYQPKR